MMLTRKTYHQQTTFEDKGDTGMTDIMDTIGTVSTNTMKGDIRREEFTMAEPVKIAHRL